MLFVTNIDLVPSTNWPPSGASFITGLETDGLSGAETGLEGPAPGDCGGKGCLGICEGEREKGSRVEENDWTEAADIGSCLPNDEGEVNGLRGTCGWLGSFCEVESCGLPLSA